MKFSRTVWCMAIARGVVVSSSVWVEKFVPVYSEKSDPTFQEWQQIDKHWTALLKPHVAGE